MDHVHPKVIPLSSPEGTVYAYACGVCHKIRVSGEFMSADHDAEQIASIAASSEEDAERCCRCERCKVVAGPFESMTPHVCGPCLPAYEADKAAREAKWKEIRERSDAIQAERLRASKDPAAATRLAECMSEISEECWCAGWLDGLEFALWEMVLGGERSYGMGEVCEEDVAALRALSEKCGGWIMWEKEAGEVFVTAEAWAQFYAERPS